MVRFASPRWALLMVVGAGLLAVGPAVPQGTPRPAPRLEAVAETRLLMAGLDLPNFRGLERRLRQKPADAETWTFVRGQALLIAESGNLLLLRPPRSQGQAAWMERATELRAVAARLAREAANRDYPRCRTSLTDLANSCNACHQTFRVPTRMVPFAEPGERSAAAVP